MAKTAVLVGGHLVRTEQFSDLTYNHKTGYLVKFSKGSKTFVHVEKISYRNVDQSSKYATAGYYEEQAFLSYRIKKILIDELQGFRIIIADLPKGVIKDKVIVRKLKITFPYTSFCKVNVFSWDYDGSPLVNLQSFQIEIPTSPPTKIVEEDVPMHTVAMAFYNRHIPIINSFFESERESAAYLISLCAIQINNIQRYIFPLFASDPLFSSYINSQNIEWTSATLFNVPKLKDLEAYLSNLSGFYRSIYANQKAIVNLKEMEKMYWFASILSAQSLSVMPAYNKVELLKYVALADISEQSRLIEFIRLIPVADLLIAPTLNNERFVLKLVESVTFAPLQGNDFLNYLLFPFYLDGKEMTTLFEVLYSKLDDNRATRYSFGLLNDTDSRKEYIRFLHIIWKKSKYNPYYPSPEYTLPPIINGVYPESYFMTENGLKFYDATKSPPTLEYESSSYGIVTIDVSFNFKIIGVKIEAEKVVEKNYLTERATGTITYEKYGTYHILQPLSIIGYKSDSTIVMPKDNFIPAFFLYYAIEYKNIKDFDFGVMLAVEVALNFTGIGELGNLRYLGHLKNISRFWKLASLPASEAVLTWSAVQELNGLITFTAGNALAISTYINKATPDPGTEALTEKLNFFLALIMLGSFSLRPVIKTKAITAAHDVITEVDRLTGLGIHHNLTPEVVTAVRNIDDNIINLISFTRNKISSTSGSAGLLAKFNALGDLEKLNFHNDFGRTNAVIYDALKANNERLFDIWKDYKILINDRKDIEILTYVNRFKNLKNNEFKHIWDLIGNNGGHRSVFVTTDLNNQVLHKIVSLDAGINTTIPNNLRTKIYTVNGHTYYEDLWRFNPNLDPTKPDVYKLLGQAVSKKSKHFVINPNWTQQHLLEEMAHAYKHRVMALGTSTNFIRINGVRYSTVRTTYRSAFSDGTIVEIIHATRAKDPASGLLVNDHISLLSIEKPL